MGDGLAAIVRSKVSALSTVRTVRMYELYSTVVQSSAATWSRERTPAVPGLRRRPRAQWAMYLDRSDCERRAARA
jgi:hypothetical protein